jgi:tetratricopeptide (TPR) repeat protein
MRSIAVLFLSISAALAQPAELPFAEAKQHVLSQAMPPYPALAKEAKVSGVVQFKLAIDASGRVESAELISGHPLLISGAYETVKTWRYRPFLLLDGTPRDITTRVGLAFDASMLTVAPVEVPNAPEAGGSGAEANMSGSAEPYSVTAKVLDDHVQKYNWPTYPPTAKAQQITGTVRMRLTVDRAGKVVDVKVVDGPSVLRDISAASARQRSYRPFLRNATAVAVVGDAYLTFTLNPDAQMPVFPGDEIDALLDAAMITVRDLKMDATQKYCLDAIERARSATEDHSYTVQDALRILYELYSRAANADPARSEELHKRLVSVIAEQERPNGYWTAQAGFGLGGVYLASRRYSDAGQQYSRAIALLDPCVDPPGTRFCSMLLGDALAYQAVVLYAQGRIAEALPYFEKAVVRPDGAIHEETKVVALSIYAKALSQTRHPLEAAEVTKRYLDYQQTHPDAAKKAGMAR